ncbi:hypothetical protein NAEGRDRAFT_81847 [Naegleria gruberi]|uniref:Peptidase A1 domain-containing protein n=1 Tax=Naegleria gruberi TaxID=5762 RepID=D2VZP0_NAEGR|nr:uncharacterized protein NAEGRDRAFT_81847 [Naegleria gruberi]EFC37730.1 hypothetical protein NAEGRDRAFT_81847 [Naegleria gruberi]|eukprot:XP_002670474.1 hypothetical protein NAEGRDRAFT_81847 [Naegleria gruberi strain NEG-M]
MIRSITSYKVLFVDGHVIIEIPQHQDDPVLYALIDTGSPVTLSSSHKNLELGGCTFLSSQSPVFGASTHKIGELIGHGLDYLIGNDVLCNFSYEIRKTKMTFYSSQVTEPELLENHNTANSIDCEMVSFPLERIMTLPIMQVTTPFKKVKMYFDTGAKLSYGSEKWFDSIPTDGSTVNGVRYLGEEDDFHPSIGKFVGHFYSLPVTVNSDSNSSELFQGTANLTMKFGILPSELSYMVTCFKGVEGIFGSELLDYYNAVFITTNRMYIY